ncbi:hypothetical protein D3C72_1469860 [compost metagenome]
MLGQIFFFFVRSAKSSYSIILTDVDQLNALRITAHCRNTIHACTDQCSACRDNHQVFIILNNLQTDYRAILIRKIDRLNPFTATGLGTIITGRCPFAVTFGRYDQHFKFLIHAIHTDDMVVVIKSNSLNAGCTAAH